MQSLFSLDLSRVAQYISGDDSRTCDHSVAFVLCFFLGSQPLSKQAFNLKALLGRVVN